MTTSKPRLNTVSWEGVLKLNQSLCQKQNLQVAHGKNCDEARRLWESSFARDLTLSEALDVCKRCNDLIPFTFNSGNTFAAISRGLVEDWANTLPALESQMVRTAIGHYVNGRIGKKELMDTLRHAEQSGGKTEKPAPAKPSPTPTPAPSSVAAPRPRQEQPA